MTERRDRLDYHCARARVGRDRATRVRRGEAYETSSDASRTTRGIWIR